MKRNLNTQEAAEYLEEIGVPFSRGTLEVWRCYGRGPEFKRVGRRVFYERQALDRFAQGQKVHTTDSLGV
jgi:hypothetical protein